MSLLFQFSCLSPFVTGIILKPHSKSDWLSNLVLSTSVSVKYEEYNNHPILIALSAWMRHFFIKNACNCAHICNLFSSIAILFGVCIATLRYTLESSFKLALNPLKYVAIPTISSGNLSVGRNVKFGSHFQDMISASGSTDFICATIFIRISLTLWIGLLISSVSSGLKVSLC